MKTKYARTDSVLFVIYGSNNLIGYCSLFYFTLLLESLGEITMSEAIILYRGRGAFDTKPKTITNNGTYIAPVSGTYTVTCVGGGAGGGGSCVNVHNENQFYWAQGGDKGNAETKSIWLNQGDEVPITIGIGGIGGIEQRTTTTSLGGKLSYARSGGAGGITSFGDLLSSNGGKSSNICQHWWREIWENRPVATDNHLYITFIGYSVSNHYTQSMYWYFYQCKDIEWVICPPGTYAPYGNSNVFRRIEMANLNRNGNANINQLVDQYINKQRYWNKPNALSNNVSWWYYFNFQTGSRDYMYQLACSKAKSLGWNQPEYGYTGDDPMRMGGLGLLQLSKYNEYKNDWVNTGIFNNWYWNCLTSIQQGQWWYTNNNKVSTSGVRTYNGDGGATTKPGNAGFILIIPPQQ